MLAYEEKKNKRRSSIKQMRYKTHRSSAKVAQGEGDKCELKIGEGQSAVVCGVCNIWLLNRCIKLSKEKYSNNYMQKLPEKVYCFCIEYKDNIKGNANKKK